MISLLTELEYFDVICRDVEEIKDKQGTPVDPLIKPLVTALLMYGFKLDGSCQGHKDWGLPYPWIDFDPGLAESQKVRTRFQDLLGEFKFQRWQDIQQSSKDPHREVGWQCYATNDLGIFGGFRFIAPNTESLELAQNNVLEFADFLIERYLE